MSAGLLLALLGLGLLTAVNFPKRAMGAILIGTLVVMVVLPLGGAVQDVDLGEVGDVLSAIKDGVRLVLDSIGAVAANLRRLHQEVVWPVRLIERARATLASLIADVRPLSAAVDGVSVRSATLTLPAALEAVIRNPGAGDFSGLEAGYDNLYGPVPSEDDADEFARNLIDVDDALALNTIKTIKASDAAGRWIREAGNQIENAAQTAAPGSAPFLTAAGLAANIESQAMMQKVLAAMIRQEAARIAHQNALSKRNGIMLNKVRENLLDLLDRATRQ